MQEDEEAHLRAVAMQNAQSIFAARQRAEDNLIQARDDLERRSSELAHSLSMMRATLDATTDAILVTDSQRRITGHNARYVELWRVPVELIERAAHGPVLAHCAGAFGAPEKFLSRVNEIYDTAPPETFDLLELKDGRVLERSSRIQFIDGQNVGRVWSFRDVTQQRHAAQDREQLLEAERSARADAERISLLKDHFLATLSHELRTPLNAILGWAQLLRRRPREDVELRDGLEVIERNARVQTQLVEDLLDMSRIISGKVRLDVQRVDMGDVVKAAVASVQHSADAKSIRLQTVIDPMAGPVRGDPNRLQQCLWNLLSNAIKFTPKGGKIGVALERVNSHLEVCVVDSGQGIKPEFLPHVFERFRQADGSITRSHGGLGLGLSIVKHLVELHGGTVRAKSGGEGQGATFCIELPLMVVHSPAGELHREHPRSSASKADLIEHPSLNGIKVLVVDDEPDARLLIKRVLEECGAQIVLAASAQEGFDLLKSERPDLLISDIGMPGEDGYEFIRRIRRLPAAEGGRTPAAALTAFARAEDRTRALRAGYQTHLAKPIEPTELSAVVESLATRP